MPIGVSDQSVELINMLSTEQLEELLRRSEDEGTPKTGILLAPDEELKALIRLNILANQKIGGV